MTAIALAAPPRPVIRVPCVASRAGGLRPAERVVPEETAVAFTYDRCAHAVMMATPADLEDFAVGFSLSEGIIAAAAEVTELEVVSSSLGIELRMSLAVPRMESYSDRRRYLAGPAGCGLCGIQSLAEAVRPAPAVRRGTRLAAHALSAAMSALPGAQVLNRETRALHAAAFWTPGHGIRALREDVGRHNALDKLLGALARGGLATAAGVVLLTSRVSVEMVQKAAVLGAPILGAVSAPSALAIRAAEACGITLVAIARGQEFEIFTHPERIVGTWS